MSPRTSDARSRMIASATLLIRERGASGTSIDDVLAHSGAPRGSVYHHFPGGRTQLLEEAVRFAADVSARVIGGEDDDPIASLERFSGIFRRTLEETDFRAGCPVAAVAVEAADDAPSVAAAVASAFARWHELLVAQLRARGVEAERAEELATLVVAGVEGGLLVARGRRSLEPLDIVINDLRARLRAELNG